jgi:hypothetical protein
MPKQSEITLRAVYPVPDLGLRADDCLVLDLKSQGLDWTLVRDVPADHPALIAALSTYQLVPLDLTRRPELEAYLHPQPAPRGRGKRGRLELVKGGA